MLAVFADATHDDTLRDAGIEHATGLIATLATDADNLFVDPVGEDARSQSRILARVAEEETERKMTPRRSGRSSSRRTTSPDHRMAQSMLRTHVAQFIDLTTKDMGLNVMIEQIRVSPPSEFAERSLAQLQLRRDLGVIVLAIRRAAAGCCSNPPRTR